MKKTTYLLYIKSHFDAPDLEHYYTGTREQAVSYFTARYDLDRDYIEKNLTQEGR